MSTIDTCPKCGALVVPQLKRCRQCNAYLHGTALEGWLAGLLPDRVASSPATFGMMILIGAYYIIGVFLAGFDSFVGFSSFSLVQLGAEHGPSVLLGEYWRFVTSNFVHHDLLHLAFNLWALHVAGQVVERLFDSKKMFLMYMVAGVMAMMISLVYYVYIRAGVHVLVVSGGASGAVSGLIGAGLIGARRLGPEGRDMAAVMIRWSIFLVLWGFLMPNINNAAHAGGFAAGAGLAYVIPMGLTKTVAKQKVLSVLSLATLAGLIVCFGLMLSNVYGYPVSLERDAKERGIFGFTYYQGHDFDTSSQSRVWQTCVDRVMKGAVSEEAIHDCELNRRVNDHDTRSYEFLALFWEAAGEDGRAERLRDVGGMVPQ